MLSLVQDRRDYQTAYLGPILENRGAGRGGSSLRVPGQHVGLQSLLSTAMPCVWAHGPRG